MIVQSVRSVKSVISDPPFPRARALPSGRELTCVDGGGDGVSLTSPTSPTSPIPRGATLLSANRYAVFAALTNVELTAASVAQLAATAAPGAGASCGSWGGPDRDEVAR